MLRPFLFVSLIFLLTGCAAMPELSKAVEDVATDTAVKVEKESTLKWNFQGNGKVKFAHLEHDKTRFD